MLALFASNEAKGIECTVDIFEVWLAQCDPTSSFLPIWLHLQRLAELEVRIMISDIFWIPGATTGYIACRMKREIGFEVPPAEECLAGEMRSMLEWVFGRCHQESFSCEVEDSEGSWLANACLSLKYGVL